MSNFLKKLLSFFSNKNNISKNIICDTSSTIEKAENVIIENSLIQLSNASLVIGKNVTIKNTQLNICNASVFFDEQVIIIGKEFGEKISISIEAGKLKIGKCSRVSANITIRFNGECSIGEYTAINDGSEIRCDEYIDIGDFNMISYNCQVYDTNTHNILPIAIRRKQTIKDFPSIGAEYTKPPTKPVYIGNDCWFGKGATILKGVAIGNGAIIGTQSVVTKDVPAFHIASGNPAVINKKIYVNS
ncbi:MAG: acyltransferase [Bacteroidetes bacterium]|nr:acyltransferase [Bacteroidota bacterium]